MEVRIFNQNPREVTLIISSNERIVKYKLVLLSLAEEPGTGNVSQACQGDGSVA
jgi:hypothetical protein